MNERKAFLAQAAFEAMRAYEVPGEEWSLDEIELLPRFLSELREESLLLDLAGGYGRVSHRLLDYGHRVVLLDLSIHSLRAAKRKLGDNPRLDIVQADMLRIPFRENSFDGVWFSQAFEYVPPELRRNVLAGIARVLKKGGVLFVNVAHIMGECGLLRYLLNYLYWRFIRKAPVRLGDYIYWLELEHYRGWHYHSLVISRRRLERLLREHYLLVDRRIFVRDYFAYILRRR